MTILDLANSKHIHGHVQINENNGYAISLKYTIYFCMYFFIYLSLLSITNSSTFERFCLCSDIWSVFENVPFALKKNIYSIVLGGIF